MIRFAILWPVFAMVALIFAVLLALAVRRLRHVRTTPPTAATFATGASEAAYFAPLDRHARNLDNLFETPVLFLALVPLLVLLRQASDAQVVLAWAFVALRAAHSLEHVRANRVRRRFRLFLASVAVLMAMWIGFLVDAASAAAAYHAAMDPLLAQP